MNRPVYRILVAEDEVIARRALRLICERSASPVEVVSEASTGRQVVEALETVRPDIILMDVVLPGMNGSEPICRVSEPRRLCWHTIFLWLLCQAESVTTLRLRLGSGAASRMG